MFVRAGKGMWPVLLMVWPLQNPLPLSVSGPTCAVSVSCWGNAGADTGLQFSFTDVFHPEACTHPE